MEIQDSLEGGGRIRYSIPVGERLPIYCTATGKAALSALEVGQAEEILKNSVLEHKTAFSITKRSELLREIEHTRQRGYSTNWEENNPQLSPGRTLCPLSGLCHESTQKTRADPTWRLGQVQGETHCKTLGKR